MSHTLRVIMLARYAPRLAVAVRRAGSHHAPVKTSWAPQTPPSHVHDGWASARLPFHVYNKWGFASKAIIFLAVGFWAPFIVVEYQLRKANQN